MARLRKGQWKAPFWGAEKKFITGLDMLGMQNTSVATYGVLVPGLTNLTRRVRYYGFYTWILEQYAKRVGRDSVTEFQKFVRRSELLISYMMADQYPDILGVTGSLYAKGHLIDFPEVIDLAAGADRAEGKKTYWKYSSGAFGQYYQGALTAMRLITTSAHNSKIHVATPEGGRRLCACFEESISESLRERFLHSVEEGRVARSDLEIFAEEFGLTHIPAGSSEQSFYRTLFLGLDFPEADTEHGYHRFRKDTVLLYLSYLNDASRFGEELEFWDTFYTSSWTGNPLAEVLGARGWLYYALNENTQYCLGAFLWHLLVRLEDKRVPLPEMLSILVEEIVAETMGFVTVSDVGELPFRDFSESVHEADDAPFDHVGRIRREGKTKVGTAAARAFVALAHMYAHSAPLFDDLTNYSRSYRMDREGDCLSFFSWMRKHQDLSTRGFLRKLILEKIINRHLEVAMRKMRNRNENTLKFIFEDNRLSLVNTIAPVFTTPRIPSLHFFLEDIGFLEEDSRTLTADGLAVLEGGIDG